MRSPMVIAAAAGHRTDEPLPGQPVVIDDDLELRNITYSMFVELGRAPRAADVAGRAPERTEAEVCAGWRRLAAEHALVLDQLQSELRMANPFSAVPTAHRVHARGRWWYANCAWDAFGICSALGVDGRIESSCSDCAQALSIDVRDGHPSDETLVFHCLVPAAHWWDDIVFT
jgi:Alkylmercury lyase